MKVNSCDAHEVNSDELNTTMKESPKRYTNPFLTDEENDELNLWNNQEHEHSINEDDFTNNLENQNFKKAEIFIDKIACYEESGFHVIKDICVDNGLSLNKTIEIDEKLGTGTDTNTDIDTDTGSTGTEDKRDEKSEDCYKNTELCCVTQESPDTDTNIENGNEECEKVPTEECGNEVANGALQKVSEDENGPPNCVSDDSKSFVESDHIAKNTENSGPEKLESTHELLLDTQIATNQLQRGGGESSFTMAGPVSGLILNSGRVASCGSISHRSDESNTSIRSFAFPILQTEWNSSPVRMAKVEQRRSPKHRGWRHAFMCCRF